MASPAAVRTAGRTAAGYHCVEGARNQSLAEESRSGDVRRGNRHQGCGSRGERGWDGMTAAATAGSQDRPARKKTSGASDEVWELRLYIAGNTARTATALDNLKKICEEHLADRYRLEIVDLMQNPTLA